jgi:hypothetical protein
MSDPTIFELLLGRHAYGMTPERETAWVRLVLLIGIVIGFLFGVSL